MRNLRADIIIGHLHSLDANIYSGLINGERYARIFTAESLATTIYTKTLVSQLSQTSVGTIVHDERTYGFLYIGSVTGVVLHEYYGLQLSRYIRFNLCYGSELTENVIFNMRLALNTITFTTVWCTTMCKRCA